MKAEVVIDTPAALALRFAHLFAGDARLAVQARGRFSCALPGGSVAEEFLPVLVREPLAWGEVEFFFGDERAVGPEDADSNYGLAQRLLFAPLRIEPRRIHRMKGEIPDLDTAARAYEQEMTAALGPEPRLDLVVLGVGTEGHVCSLFPEHPLLRERNRAVAPILDSPKPPPRRITFTLPTIERARTVCVAAFGRSKADAIRQALEVAASQIPVALAVRAATRVIVLIDVDAASGLGRQRHPA